MQSVHKNFKNQKENTTYLVPCFFGGSKLSQSSSTRAFPWDSSPPHIGRSLFQAHQSLDPPKKTMGLYKSKRQNNKEDGWCSVLKVWRVIDIQFLLKKKWFFIPFWNQVLWLLHQFCNYIKMVRSKDLMGFFLFQLQFICLFVCLIWGSFLRSWVTLGFQGKGISSPDKILLPCVKAPNLVWRGF